MLKNMFLLKGLCIVHITCALEVKATNIKVKGHVGQGQRSNKDPRERQVGSQQRKVASF